MEIKARPGEPIGEKPKAGELGAERARELYRRMRLIRSIEDTVQSLFQKGYVHGTTHLQQAGERATGRALSDGLRRHLRSPHPRRGGGGRVSGKRPRLARRAPGRDVVKCVGVGFQGRSPRITRHERVLYEFKSATDLTWRSLPSPTSGGASPPGRWVERLADAETRPGDF